MAGSQPGVLIVKRYPNRKLYNTQQKEYITLDQLAALVRQGVGFQVVDYATGDDLTAITLAQVILEQQKIQDRGLPIPLLFTLIRGGGDVLEGLRRVFLSSLDFERFLDDEIKRRISSLIKLNQLSLEEGSHLIVKLQAVAKSLPGPGLQDHWVSRWLEDHGFASRQDYINLLAKVDALAAQVKQLSSHRQL